MDTKVLTIEEHQINREFIQQAGKFLKEGKSIAFPTETVYGLGGNALDPHASAKIYEAKGRPSDNPLIIHIADMDDLPYIVKEVSEQAKALAKTFWPGPLTMIFKKSDVVPYETTGGLETVAVRMPNHPIALELIRQGGKYVAAPSANTSGRPSPTCAKHVIEDLKGRVDVIIDGGDVGIGLESTIIDMSVEVPTILRPGAITQEMLQQVIGDVLVDPGLQVDKHTKPKAPGMKYKHYAPKAELIIIEGEIDKVVETINQMVLKDKKDGKKSGVIGTDDTIHLYQSQVVKSIGTRKKEETIAKHLYGVLREFDEIDIDRIYSESFKTPKLGQAIMNRLLKAAGHHVIKV